MKRNQIEKKSESVNHDVTKDTDQTNHPWNTLTTVTTFDQGDNTESTLCLNGTNENQTGTIGRTSSSLLIESLIQQLCALETDKTRRRNLYIVICNQLHQLKLIDGSYNLTEYETFRRQYDRAFSRLFSIACVMTGNESIPRSYLIPEWSRYHQEFQEINRIAKGGFGEVYKALHRLDGIEYAIKKIALRSNRPEVIKEYLNEVKTLAKLNHTNIVSYKAAWIEPILSSFISTIVSSTDRESDIRHTSDHMKTSEHLQSVRNSCTKNSPSIDWNDTFDNEMSNAAEYSTDKGVLQEYTEDNTKSSDIVSFRNSNSNENSNKSKDTESKETNTDRDIHTYIESTSNQAMCTYSNGNQQYMILYIQMHLCEQTLGQWMHERISQTPQPIISAVLQQILCGVDYIHSQNVVHHDIKPSNIFISTSGQLQVQLGDFGLACPLQKETHRSVIGTHMYAAPEQLDGKCDQKSDIYSVGIVLTELLIPTDTQMELSTIINCLKSGDVPQSVAVDRHKWAHMIIQMVQHNPVKRPWTKQLLKDLIKDNETRKVNELEQIIEVLTHRIRNRDDTIQELRDTVASLKEQVRKLSTESINENV